MTFSQLKTFLEVARQGSVRGAAASLLITEPSVSAALAALRDELQVALVARDGRGIRLTPAGTELARYAAQILGLTSQHHLQDTAFHVNGRQLAAFLAQGGVVEVVQVIARPGKAGIVDK